jgi:DMSO reductase anchor subunit
MSGLGWLDWVPGTGALALIAGFTGAGLLFSLGHLGRPLRGSLALSRLGRSPLSNEILAVGVTVGASALSLALPSGSPLKAPLGFLALVGATATLLALGLVYRLHGCLTWRGTTVLHPLVSGMTFGVVSLLWHLPQGAQARGELLALAFLLTDGVLFWHRTRRLNTALGHGTPVHPRFMDQRVSLSVLRTLLGVLLPAVALLDGGWKLAWVGLFLNLFLDRFLFYSLAVRETTEGEILRIEALLKSDVERSMLHSGSKPPTLPAIEG